MVNEQPGYKHNFDLEERTAKFGEEVIEFCNDLPHDRIIDVLVKQLVRSATSIGANYMEADCSSSRKDFKYKISLCRKEAKETMHWLRMMVKAHSNIKNTGRILWQEAHELTLIFSSIFAKRHT